MKMHYKCSRTICIFYVRMRLVFATVHIPMINTNMVAARNCEVTAKVGPINVEL